MIRLAAVLLLLTSVFAAGCEQKTSTSTTVPSADETGAPKVKHRMN